MHGTDFATIHTKGSLALGFKKNSECADALHPSWVKLRWPNLLIGCFFGERAQIWIRACLAIAVASLFSYSLLRGNVQTYLQNGRKYPQNGRNKRRTSTNANHATIGICKKRAFFWERALLGSLGKNSWLEQFLFPRDTFLR